MFSNNTTTDTVCGGYLVSIGVLKSNEFVYPDMYTNITVSLLFMVAGTLLNFIVILAIATTPSLKTPSNILILGLALADLGASFCPGVTGLVFKVSIYKDLEDIFCPSGVVLEVSVYFFFSVSFLTLCCTSLERYLLLLLHLRYNEVVTNFRICIVLVVIWIFAAVFTILRMFYPNTAINAFFTTAILLGFAVTIFCFGQTLRIVRKHRTQIQAQNQQSLESMKTFKKSVLTMLYIHLLFLVCYSPVMVVLAVAAAVGSSRGNSVIGSKIPVAFSFFSALMMLANSLLNPILYFWRLAAIRQSAIRSLERLCKIG
ncbi:alpha-1B adrenergic receptor [Nematostella vectensis]|uniref:alpha-1B adrenergic receptor n=1 Tax=Nematostella vectensis TaxID=45351 RepID=UPI002076F101|nr:alpha-1B adrenergic receptor [Nematostella vectensis]